MAYTPTKWQDHIPEVQDGTPVSAVNMNKIEEGIMQAHQVADSTASALDHAYHPLFPYYSAGATGDSTSTIYYTADGLTTGVYLPRRSGILPICLQRDPAAVLRLQQHDKASGIPYQNRDVLQHGRYVRCCRREVCSRLWGDGVGDSTHGRDSKNIHLPIARQCRILGGQLGCAAA